MKHIYIVISQTGTILSTILKQITEAKYNHVSISLNKNLEPMYSFGRINPYNPILGGFVKESKNFGTFKRFTNTEVIVMEIPVKEYTYEKMKNELENMYEHKKEYHYNILGLILAAFHIAYNPQNEYYCSSFVGEILIHNNIARKESFTKIIEPIFFYKLFQDQTIYEGKLRDYTVYKINT